VQAANIDFNLTTTEIVSQYLENANTANDTYLSEEGASKIIAITGTIVSIATDQKNQKVILLQSANDKAGVSCTFTSESNINAKDLQKGDTVTIKGVIRSGAGFDEDLDMYEDVILEKCDVINQQ
jgi:RecG-like helicase